MLLFAMDRVILLEFDISQLVEVRFYVPFGLRLEGRAYLVGLLRYHLLLLPHLLPTSAK
jgi:hypothetical protein